MSQRMPIRARRALETIAIESAGQRFKIGIGRDWDGEQLGPVVEVWVNAQKVDSALDVIASDAAILLSLLIQYGHSLDDIVKSLKRGSDGKPASPIGVVAALVFEATQQGG